MSGNTSPPVTPDEYNDATTPGSETASDRSTPLDEGIPDSPGEAHKRVPSLPPLSDPHNMNPNSTPLGILGAARKPVMRQQSSFAGGAGLDNSAMAKARALHQQRMQKGSAGSGSPSGPSPTGGPNGFPGKLQMPGGMAGGMAGGMSRPGPAAGAHHQSAPVLPKTSLADRRAKAMGGGMNLSDMGGGGGDGGAGGSPSSGRMRRPNAPSLSGMGGDPDPAEQHKQTSKLDDFKKFIDADKGWITFDGAATITREGVNFASGQTFKISLDEVEIVSELGKGNYGTVYLARHAKPRVPRFGHGLSGAKPPMPHTVSDTVIHPKDDGTTGLPMAMKETRLELDDAKFTTILKELVILHECVSPYIIDFYGAFFQDGAVYMCIEYMDGGSIDKLYAGGVPENILRKITHATVMGLKCLKDEHNIIHRDVKPTNILANTRGQIKICDFGVSGNLVASIAKTNIGCQSYMAPERISGGGMSASGNADGTYSVQSDVWSLGLSIIECATGQYPYPPEVSSTIFSQLSAIVEGEPPSLPDHFSDVAKDFVKACLHKVPKQRPTYAMLLKHPWLKEFSKPETIVEEAEEGDEAEEAAQAVSKLNMGSGTEDEEIATWVKSILTAQGDGKQAAFAERPALHAAPLDTVSPMASPQIGAGPDEA